MITPEYMRNKSQDTREKVDKIEFDKVLSDIDRALESYNNQTAR